MAKKPRTPRKPTAKAKPAEPVASFEVTDGSKPLDMMTIGGAAFLLKPWPGQIVIENKLIRRSGDRFTLQFFNAAGTYRVVQCDDHFTHGEMLASTWSTPPSEVTDA